jgi:membrane protease YdiL (CAAX protease family)
MDLFGPGFRAGLRAATYRPYNPAGLGSAVAIFIALVIINQIVLQGIFTAGIAAIGASDFETFRSGLMRGALLSLFPAGLLTALLSWVLARRHGADPSEVLALRPAGLGIFGWMAVIIGFPSLLFSVFGLLTRLLGISDTSSGIVEQALVQLGHDPLYVLIAAGLIVGAPLAEEFVFRGQIFAALSQTRMGFTGSAIVTSALWAALHITEPVHLVGLIFLMGLVLSWLLVRFGSLWVTIVCHSVWNALTTLILYAMALQ